MADPTGTVGAAQGGDSEFAMISRGGANFLARIKALGDLRDAQEAAAERLKLGQDVHAALNDASNKRDQAQETLARAMNALTDAKTRSAAMIADARSQADQIVLNAQAEGQKATDSAGKVRADADAYATATMAHADQAIAAAQKDQQQAQTARETAEAAARSHGVAESAAKEAVELANARHAELQQKLERLAAAIREVT